MDRAQVVDLYDEGYAASYDGRFLLADRPKPDADFEVSVLRQLLRDHSPWLDVGCGTGYFLGRFPGFERAGIDLAPAMVARARAANPDAMFIDERSFLDDCADWHGVWRLVSCTWGAYQYLGSIWEVEQLIDNVVQWTAGDGGFFIPVLDLEEIRGQTIPYEAPAEPWGGTIALTGFTWTWDEPTTHKRHQHLVAPHVEHLVRLLTPHFRKIEIIRYPSSPRKAIVATGRDRSFHSPPAEVVRHPPPPVLNKPQAGLLGTGELLRELARRARLSVGRP